jgi:hypothetical protein
MADEEFFLWSRLLSELLHTIQARYVLAGTAMARLASRRNAEIASS